MVALFLSLMEFFYTYSWTFPLLACCKHFWVYLASFFPFSIFSKILFSWSPFCLTTQSFSILFKRFMIEVNLLLGFFLNVSDWKRVQSFLIPLAVNFLFLNFATGALLPKTARCRSASRLWVGKSARSSSDKRCNCIALGSRLPPSPNPYSRPAYLTNSGCFFTHL